MKLSSGARQRRDTAHNSLLPAGQTGSPPPLHLTPSSPSPTHKRLVQVQRMETALRAVEQTLYGMRKPRRLDRASLDVVSISQLQAAVDNFAAVGDGALAMMGGGM